VLCGRQRGRAVVYTFDIFRDICTRVEDIIFCVSIYTCVCVCIRCISYVNVITHHASRRVNFRDFRFYYQTISGCYIMIYAFVVLFGTSFPAK